MKSYHYVEESDDLKLARQKDAEQYREFLEWDLTSRYRLWFYGATAPFSHLYDARKVAA